MSEANRGMMKAGGPWRGICFAARGPSSSGAGPVRKASGHCAIAPLRGRWFVLALACLGPALWAAPSLASSATAGSVSALTAEQGRVFFTHSGTRTATPACHTQGARWVINGNTAAGQAQIAVLLSLQAQGKQITVMGTGACPDWGDTETVEYIMQAN